MRTYREVFSVGEFRALFGGQVMGAASMTLQSLAFSLLIYSRTASPLLAAVAFLAGSLPQAVGAMTLSGFADAVAPRILLVASDGVRATAFILLASGLLSTAAMLAIVMLLGIASGALGGVRYALVTRVLSVDSYALGRSMLNVAVGAMQVVGYASGGGLILAVGVHPALWLAAAMAIAVVAIDRWGILARPALARGSASIRTTWRRNRALIGAHVTRRLLLAQWVPNGLIVGAEALFVPYAGGHAAWLFAASGAGMLVGDVIVGRWVASEMRVRMTRPLYLLLAAPYLAFAAHPSLLVAVGVVGVASIGFGGTLGLQQRLVEVLPEASLGQAFALASAGMLSAQGIAAYLTGGLAQALGAPVAMAIAGAASLLATVALLARRGHGRTPAETSLERRRARRLSVPTSPTAARSSP